MTAPTLINTVQINSPWAQTLNMGVGVATLNYSAALTTSAGDLIVSMQGSGDGLSGHLTTTDGTNSYTQQTHSETATTHGSLNIATATDGAGGSRTLTLNRASTSTALPGGGVAFQFRNHGGVGNVLAATDDVQTGNLTCSANSAVVALCVSWGAETGSRSWANINGSAPTSTGGVDGDGATWGVAWAYYADVGSAGSKTITLSTPNYSGETFAAIEILAGGSSAPAAYANQRNQQ